MSSKKTVIIVAGPTAVGKTAVGIAIARQFNTAIISADSRQCYKELNIGVARPSEDELAAVPHHFIATHSIQEKVTAATFEQYALQKAKALFEDKEVVVMVGGTGLYIKAFCEGLDEVPEVPEEIREDLNDSYQKNGLAWLQEEVARIDPKFYATGEIQNPHRLLRALEVKKATSRSIVDYRSGIKKQREFKVIKIALQLPKEQLHVNINTRVDVMMEQGLLEEVKSVLPYQHLTALQTVGYKELFAYLNKEIGLPAAIELIKKNTRQYAKRQLTWFRRDSAFQWFEPGSTDYLPYLTTKLNA
jgi:tRNA dimethylallyltransferase